MYKIYIHLASKTICTITYNDFHDQQRAFTSIKTLISEGSKVLIADNLIIRCEHIEFMSTEN